MGPKYRAGIKRSAKKKKPPGRQWKKVVDDSDSVVDFSTTQTTDEDISTCSKKFKVDEDHIKQKRSSIVEDNSTWCYLLLDTRIINNIVDAIGSCPSCSQKISVFHNIERKRGLAHFLVLSCTKCDWCKTFSTSEEVKKTNTNNEDTTKSPGSGRHAFDINIRSVIAMREIGRGYTALQTLCGFLNIPSPMTKKTFLETQSSVGSVYVKVAEANMNSAATEVRKVDGVQQVTANEVVNTTISTDGTWQKRGFSSRNGVVTIISNSTGKCVDYRVKTKTCKACSYWKGKTGAKAEKFRRIHKCPLNHTKSSGAMEADGVLECFLSSVIKRQLRYLTYIGDGDTKSFQNVVNANPYPSHEIVKAECIGHIQKRVGTRLRKFKSECKELMPESFYADKKDKKQKKLTFYLTHKMINRLQNYYGIAIRATCKTSVPPMRKAVGAVLFHCSEAVESDSRHQFCPKSPTSWCKYQVDQANSTSDYIEKPGLPIPLRKKLEPIFRELSSPELLAKCMHGQTQNNNESINGVIWKRCPKDTFVGRNVVEMSVSSAVISFNSGKRGLFDVYHGCNLETGSYTELFCYLDDAGKVCRQNIKSSVASKKRRKTLRSIAKGYIDNETVEEPSYSSGSFSV